MIGLRPAGEFYDYDAKYVSGDTQYLLPCGLDEETEKMLGEIALRAYRGIGCEGWGRVDFIVDENRKPWLIEVNTCPGMTERSLVPQAAAFAGVSFDELVLEIIKTARLKSALWRSAVIEVPELQAAV